MSKPEPRNLVLAVLALLAVGVVVLLPRFVSAPLIQVDADSGVATPAPQEVAPSRVAEKRQFRQQAQDTLAEVFAARERLEKVGVEHWGAEAWQRGLDLISSGDLAYGRGEYGESLDAYNSALDTFRKLEARAETLREESLAGAEQAIEDGLVDRASAQVELLGHVAPGDSRQQVLAARLDTLPAVVDLLAEGERALEAGNPALAQQRFARAVALDADHRRAARLLAQAREAEAAATFSERMGAGYSAMERGDVAGARSHFEAARAVDPDNPGVRQALAQLENRGTRAQVDDRLARARTFEEREQWGQAVAIYEELLALDSTLADPRARLVPARVRSELDERLAALIADPLALSRPAQGERARQALADARGIAAPGERLRGQIDTLATLLERATTPVTVRFRSDNATEVTLFRVGRLGTFESREVELKPGRYVAAGTRRGYRDVQVEFTVSGESRDTPIVVRCTEAI